MISDCARGQLLGLVDGVAEVALECRMEMEMQSEDLALGDAWHQIGQEWMPAVVVLETFPARA
jgi:hypothetical protein